MLMSTVNQAYIFLATVYGGLLIGFLYDVNRMLRKIFRYQKVITGILDLLFWLTTCFSSFAVLYYANDGQLRFYTFIGFALGIMLYLLAWSPLVMGIFMLLYKLFRRMLRFLIRIPIWLFSNAKKKIPLHFKKIN